MSLDITKHLLINKFLGHIHTYLQSNNSAWGSALQYLLETSHDKNSETSGFVETRNIESFIEKNWQQFGGVQPVACLGEEHL
jgi:hypothetical protein